MAAMSNPPLCPDWVYLNNADVHVAKDRGWFKTYTPFASTLCALTGQLTCQSSSDGLPVVGIGTVELLVKRSPNRSGVAAHGTLVLTDVLHVPSGICNVIGNPVHRSTGSFVCTAGNGRKSMGRIQDENGKSLAYFQPNRSFFILKLRGSPAGPRIGPSVLNGGVLYLLWARWDPAERQRWEDFKNGYQPNASVLSSSNANNSNPPYTPEEKDFLKLHWQGEFHFLQVHGLKIYKEEDREEGRSILRALREEIAEDSLEQEFSDDDDDEFDLLGRQADYNFSERQMDWIDQHYGNSERFMMSYGLKWYDDEDVEEAKAIADAMMEEDDEEDEDVMLHEGQVAGMRIR